MGEQWAVRARRGDSDAGAAEGCAVCWPDDRGADRPGPGQVKTSGGPLDLFFPAPAKHFNSNTWSCDSCQLSRKIDGDVPHNQTLLVNICDFYISILFASCHILRFL